MPDRIEATIKFKMPEEWLDSQHPVGAAIQGLYTELAKAYLTLDRDGRWAEWAESYEDVED